MRPSLVTLVMISNVVELIDEPGFGNFEWLIDNLWLVIFERCQSIDEPKICDS